MEIAGPISEENLRAAGILNLKTFAGGLKLDPSPEKLLKILVNIIDGRDKLATNMNDKPYDLLDLQAY